MLVAKIPTGYDGDDQTRTEIYNFAISSRLTMFSAIN
jgi:hypothetical protein